METKIGKSSVNHSDNSKRLARHSHEEPVFKKSRYDESTAINSNVEPDIHQMTSFPCLPPELVERILKDVSTCDLLNCRHVNRQWNEISSRIIRSRDDISLRFAFASGDRMYLQRFEHPQCKQCSLSVCKEIPISRARSLDDLVAFLIESPLFPFTSFRFDTVTWETFRTMRKFLKIWGSRVLSLDVTLASLTGRQRADILRRLFEKVSNLKKLTFGCFSNIPDSFPSLIDVHPLQLSKLEVFCGTDGSRKVSTIVEDILTSSPNLKRFAMIERPAVPEDLEMMHRLKKLHCLKDLNVSITEDLITYWKRSPDLFELQLRSLTLSFDDTIYLDQQLNSSASDIINQWFHSSRNTMQTLDTNPLRSLTGLVFPKFEQLIQLRLRQNWRHKDDAMFPSGLVWNDKFPNLKELDLSEYGAMLDDSISDLPSIVTLKVSWDRNRQVFGELIRRTPNVRTLLIKDDYSCLLEGVPNINLEEISIHIPHLEILSWQIHLNDMNWSKLDTLITGLPVNSCRKLARIFRNKDYLSADKISGYWKRCDSSILDLKELKSLHLHIDYYYYNIESDGANRSTHRDKAGFGSESIFYETGLTKVSKFLGFDRMPNLKVVIH